MSRAPRKPSVSETYHVMVRGVGRQILFEDDVDRRFYLEVLGRELSGSDGELLAWCLMDNHVHLLVRMGLSDLSEMMRALGSAYAVNFNRRHDRVGHLFQDRFKSEPVESDAYLLAVVRYIHQNPVKAGITPTCDYRWSSYRSYVGEAEPFVVTSCETVLGMFESPEAFVRFHQVFSPGVPCLSLGDKRRAVADEEALGTARRALCDVRPEEVASLPRPQRNDAIRRMRTARLSIRQIERITGVSRGVVAGVR